LRCAGSTDSGNRVESCVASSASVFIVD
jgi:hypothetical protein